MNSEKNFQTNILANTGPNFSKNMNFSCLTTMTMTTKMLRVGRCRVVKTAKYLP